MCRCFKRRHHQRKLERKVTSEIVLVIKTLCHCFKSKKVFALVSCASLDHAVNLAIAQCTLYFLNQRIEGDRSNIIFHDRSARKYET